MAKTEREKMAAGEWYACVDDELDALRTTAQTAVFEHNCLPPTERGDIGPALRALLGSDGESARIEAPFYCPYGFNIFLGRRTFVNAGCTVLDTAPVRIGDGAYVGSGSVVTKDVPADALAIARSQQVNKEGGAARLRELYNKMKKAKI